MRPRGVDPCEARVLPGRSGGRNAGAEAPALEEDPLAGLEEDAGVDDRSRDFGVAAHDITSVRLAVTPQAHAYWIGGQQGTNDQRSYWLDGENAALRWKHPHSPLTA
ncbi:hypothetical protein GCM10009864_35070 [Streptomyces lunalinharesii]|uniref:Uncharacterized protein n=1 Tax=Streptomyces lunalinharesii TaxID=333384 RepID=A0ABP6EC65_9ACTN